MQTTETIIQYGRTVNVNFSTPNSGAATINLSNIEALAQGENGGGYTGCTSGGGYCAIYWNGKEIFSSYSHYPY